VPDLGLTDVHHKGHKDAAAKKDVGLMSSLMKEFFAGRLLAKPLAAGEIAFRPRRLEAMA
jgi:hypothetical protein